MSSKCYCHDGTEGKQLDQKNFVGGKLTAQKQNWSARALQELKLCIAAWWQQATEYVRDRMFIMELRRRGRDAFFLVAAPPPQFPRSGRDRKAAALAATLERSGTHDRSRGRDALIRQRTGEEAGKIADRQPVYGFYLIPDRHVLWFRRFGLGLAYVFIFFSLLFDERSLPADALLFNTMWVWTATGVLGVLAAVQILVWHNAFQPPSYEKRWLRLWELICGISAVCLTYSPLWFLALWQYDLSSGDVNSVFGSPLWANFGPQLWTNDVCGPFFVTDLLVLAETYVCSFSAVLRSFFATASTVITSAPFSLGILFWLFAGVTAPLVIFGLHRRGLMTSALRFPVMSSNHWGYLAESLYRRYRRVGGLYWGILLDHFYRKQRAFNQIDCFGPRFNRQAAMRERAMVELFLEQTQPSGATRLPGFRLSILRYTFYFLSPLWVSLFGLVVIILYVPSFEAQGFSIFAWVLLSILFIEREAANFLRETAAFARYGGFGHVKDGNMSLLPPFSFSYDQRRALLRFVLSEEADRTTINLPIRIVGIAGGLLGVLASAG